MQFNLRPTGVEIVFIYSDYVGPEEEKRRNKGREEEDDELECFKSNMFKKIDMGYGFFKFFSYF
jgi:hypothetical protein